MTRIRPRDPRLLTERDVDHARFRCCGDEDLVFLRCEPCGHIWVMCHECDTWYVDLENLAVQRSASEPEPPRCPRCQVAFADRFYLREDHVDVYLATAGQVIAAGHAHLLAPHVPRTPVR